MLESSDTVEFGRVIRTEPGAGETATTGSTVRLVVSGGREQVPVPNVVNLQEEEANGILSENFSVEIQSEASEDVDEGLVIRTEPAAKPARAARVQGHHVRVAGLEPRSRSPRCRGSLRDDAIASLEALGLQASTIEAVSTPGNVGRVIAQSREPDTEVAPGTTITLTIGVEGSTTTTAPTTDSSTPTT